MSVNACKQYGLKVGECAKSVQSALAKGDVDDLVGAIAKFIFQTHQAIVETHKDDCKQCQQTRQWTNGAFVELVAKDLASDLEYVSQKITALLKDTVVSQEKGEMVTRCRDKWLGSTWAAIAISALKKVPTSDLPVWSLQGKHAKHYLIGTVHLSSANIFHEKSKVTQAIRHAQMFIGELGELKDFAVRDVEVKAQTGFSFPDFLFQKKAREQSGKGGKPRSLFMGLDTVKEQSKVGNLLNSSKRVGAVRQLLQIVEGALAAHFSDLKRIAKIGEGLTDSQKKMVFTDREKRWIEKGRLIKMLTDSKFPICVYVGAAHFVRKGGLLEKFAAAGLKAKLLTGTDS